MHLFSDVYVYLDFFVFVVHSIGVSCPLKDNISANQFFRRAQRTPAGNIEFPLTVYRQTFTCEILLAYECLISVWQNLSKQFQPRSVVLSRKSEFNSILHWFLRTVHYYHHSHEKCFGQRPNDFHIQAFFLLLSASLDQDFSLHTMHFQICIWSTSNSNRSVVMYHLNKTHKMYGFSLKWATQWKWLISFTWKPPYFILLVLFFLYSVMYM